MTAPAAEDFARLVAEGKSDVEIAQLLAVSPRTVLRWRKARGLPSKWQPTKNVKHGNRTRYNRGCRCNMCKAAVADAHRELKGKEPPLHGTASAYVNFGCRCNMCRAAGSIENGQRAPRYLTLKKTLNDESRQHATRHGYMWTGPELEIISRSNLTSPECAAILGRTIAAVSHQRVLLRKGNPKKTRLRGSKGDPTGSPFDS